ncbi:MAG: TRAP transporter small permease [Rhodospirillales bacterium]|nr:TRAP transporter small permease [Rhodospirillales bacterium]
MSQSNAPARSEAEAGAQSGTRGRMRPSWFLSIEGVCSLIVVEITLLMFAVVVARYVFGEPLIWAEETVRYSFTWLAFLSAALAMKHGGHMAIDLLASVVPPRFEHVVRGTVELSVVVFLVMLAYYGIEMTMITHGQSSSALQIPMSFVYASLPVGCSLMAWYSLLRMIRFFRKA